ncbi:MAG: autotransporter outer membrane beta-barrel domain-containing protein, partial [Pseudomonadota bacterium]
VTLNADAGATGTFTIEGDGIFAADGGALSRVTLERGRIEGIGTIQGSLAVGDEAFLAPGGSSIGFIQVAGDYTQSGSIEIDFRPLADGLGRGRNVLEGTATDNAGFTDQDADLLHILGAGDIGAGVITLNALGNDDAFLQSLSQSPDNELRYLIVRADQGLGGTTFGLLGIDSEFTLEYPNANDVELVLTGTPIEPPRLVTSAPPELVRVGQSLWQSAITHANERPQCDNRLQNEVEDRCVFLSTNFDFSEIGRDVDEIDHYEGRGSLGMGWKVSDNGWVGGALGYGYGSFDDLGTLDSDFNRVSGTIWSTWRNESGFDLRGWVGLSYFDVDFERVDSRGIPISADHDAWQFSSTLEMRSWLQLGKKASLAPIAGFQYSRLERGQLAEQGDTDEIFVADQAISESAQSILGLDFELDYSDDTPTPSVVNIHASWLHEFADTEVLVEGLFPSDTQGTFFTTRSQDIDEERLRIGANVQLNIGQGTLQVGYEGQFTKGFEDHTAGIRYTRRW